MDNEELKALIEKLMEKIEHLLESKNSPDNSINELRIAFQYIMLDLEATRRERDIFHGMLEDMDNPPQEYENYDNS